jgi:hypothetical protein
MFTNPNINQVYIMQLTYKMHFNVYDVFYSQFSHKHVSAAIVAIFRVILKGYKDTNVVSCVAVST